MPTLALGPVRVYRRSHALVAAYGRGECKEIVIREKRAVEIFRRVIEVWQSRESLLADLVPPEVQMLCDLKAEAKKEISLRDQALLIWTFARMNLSGRKAVEMAPTVKTIWREMPWLMRPELVGQASVHDFYFEDLREVMPAVGWRPEIFDYWVNGLKRLHNDYAGDPREIIYLAKGDRVRFCKIMAREFDGIGHKIAQMLIVFFREWAEENDADLFREIQHFDPCIPIDVWWLRGLRQLDILKSWSSLDRESSSWPLSFLVSEICKRYHLPYWDLVQGMWHIFSLICGRRRPNGQNGKAAEFCFKNCPLNQWCNWIVPTDFLEVNQGKMAWDQGRIIKRQKYNSRLELPKPTLGL